MKKNILNSVFLIIIFVAVSCDYHSISYEEDNLKKEVSFTTNIEPAFQQKCLSCHTTSNPVLTKDKARESLLTGNYIDLDNPDQSIVYLKTKDGHPGGNNVLTPSELALLLKWIEQGAMDN